MEWDFLFSSLLCALRVLCGESFFTAFRKKSHRLRFHARGAIESREERLPLFRGNGELALFSEDVLGLQTGAVEDEISQADAGGLGAGANEFLLAAGGAEIDAPGPNRSGTRIGHGSSSLLF